jgi:hypothetical protein
MSSITRKDHPVLVISKTPWCGACKDFLNPKTYNQVLSIIRSINPDTEIRIVVHEDYGKTNKVDNYPHVKYINGFPSLMITSVANCHKNADFSTVYIYDGIYDNGAIRPSKGPSIDLDVWLKKYLDPKLYSGKIKDKSVVSSESVENTIMSLLTPTPKNGDSQKSFTLLPLND